MRILTMESEEKALDFRLIAGARQVVEIPAERAVEAEEEDDALDEEAPLYITWFALGHVAVLTFIAAHALHALL